MTHRALIGILEDAARSQPDRVYFYGQDGPVSYAKALAAVRRLSGIIRGKGWGSSMIPVGVNLEDPVRLLYVAWACADAGVSLAFCPQYRDPKLARSALEQVGGQVLLTDDDGGRESCWDLVRGELAERLDLLRTVPLSGTVTPPDASEGAFLLPTSGTDGKPKWVACHFWKCRAVVECMEESGALSHAAGQVVFLTPPLFHSYGLSAMLEFTRAGATLLFPQAGARLGPLADLMNEKVAQRVTALEAVPFFYAQLSALRGRIRLPNVAHIGLGGDLVHPAILEKLRSCWPNATYSVRYGLTETPSVVSHRVFHPPHTKAWRISGRVLPIYEVEIVDECLRPTVANEEGEIVVRGAFVAPYHGDEADAAVLRTGDLGYLDGQGELVVVGRKSLFLKRRGYRVSPQLIESTIGAVAGVRDCQVTARDDRLIAELVYDADDFSPVLIMKSLVQLLPSYAVPDEIVRVSSIARTMSGKIKRR